MPAKKKDTLAGTYFVKALPERGFYRAGLFFPHGGTTVELSEEQAQRVLEEPLLVAVPGEGTAPADEE